MDTINFINGGKLGDFIHGLFAVKNICEQQNKKANLYLYDIGWEFGFDTAFEQLSPVVSSQSYIHSFNKLTEYTLGKIITFGENNEFCYNIPTIIHNNKLSQETYIDLGNYIRSSHLYQKCWTDIFLLDYNLPFTNYKWINHNTKDNYFSDKLIINRRAISPERLNAIFPYEKLLDKYESRTIFISATIDDYEAFPYNNRCSFYEAKTISDFFTVINSCELFVGNLSSPLTIASSLDVPRIAELCFRPDAYHWFNETAYSKNIQWYLDDNNKYGDIL